MLSSGIPSIRQQVLIRYIKLHRSLLSSPSKEVAVVARIVGSDASTNTGSNILNIKIETKLSPGASPMSQFFDVVHKPMEVPHESRWRIPLLERYIAIRESQEVACEDTEYIESLIASLCST